MRPWIKVPWRHRCLNFSMEESIKHGTALLETMRNWKKCCNLKYSFSLKYLTQIFNEFCKYTSFPVAEICGWVVSWRRTRNQLPPLLPLSGHSSGTLQILKQLGTWKKIWCVQVVFTRSRIGISRRVFNPHPRQKMTHSCQTSIWPWSWHVELKYWLWLVLQALRILPQLVAAPVIPPKKQVKSSTAPLGGRSKY